MQPCLILPALHASIILPTANHREGQQPKPDNCFHIYTPPTHNSRFWPSVPPQSSKTQKSPCRLEILLTLLGMWVKKAYAHTQMQAGSKYQHLRQDHEPLHPRLVPRQQVHDIDTRTLHGLLHSSIQPTKCSP